MTTVVAVEVAVAAVASLATAAVLWRGSRRVPLLRSPMRWLALAALAWGAGLIAERAITGALDGTAVPVSFGDLASLLAVPVLVAGLMTMAAVGRPGPAGTVIGTTGTTGGTLPPIKAGDALARLTDGYVLAAGLFVVGWVTLFDSAYRRSGDGAGGFALVLIHPLVDLAALAITLPFAIAAGRRGLAPYLALCAMTVSDALAVGARATAADPGIAVQFTALVRVLPAGLHPAGRGRPGPAARRQPADARRHRAGPPGSAPVRCGPGHGGRHGGRGAGRAGRDRRRDRGRPEPGSGARPGRRHRPAGAGRPGGRAADQGPRRSRRAAGGGPPVPCAGRPDRRRRAGLRPGRDDQVGQPGQCQVRLCRGGPGRAPPGRPCAPGGPGGQHPGGADRGPPRPAVGPVQLPGQVRGRHLAARRGAGVPLPRPGRPGPAAGHRARRQRPGRAAPPGDPPDLPRRADRAAQPGLPGGPGQGHVRGRAARHGRGDLPGPGRVHRGERLGRARRGRPAAHPGRPAAAGRGAVRGHRGPVGRRRVRRAGRGRGQRAARSWTSPSGWPWPWPRSRSRVADRDIR